MESKTDDALKATFLAVRNEIYNRFTTKQQNEQQAASAALKRSMTERERESEVIEIDTDITAPGASKKTNRTVTDLLIKKPTHADFVAAWSEALLSCTICAWAWTSCTVSRLTVSRNPRVASFMP